MREFSEEQREKRKLDAKAWRAANPEKARAYNRSAKKKENYKNRSKPELTAELLREMLHYDPVTGVFIWVVDRGGTARVGTVAGTLDDLGYRYIMLFQCHYQAHRLAWLYMTGAWPDEEIDHRDTNPLNNSFTNLREATTSQQRFNRRMQINNACGLKGVRRATGNRKKPWMATIGLNYRQIFLGYYATPEEGHEAYAEASKIYHGEYGRVA